MTSSIKRAFAMMRKEGFQIGKVSFRWGAKLADIKAQLSTADTLIENYNSHAIDKTLTIKLPEMWLIKTSSCEFSAVDDDRLIHRIRIDIAANKYSYDNSWLKTFIKHPLIEKLKKQLGSPSTHRVGDNCGSNTVVENATWLFENCEVGISIFGGVREENGETNIGLIYITLKDIELLDEHYAQPLREIEAFLQNKIELVTVKIFKMQTSQQRSWSSDAHKYPKHSIDFISRALNGFHNRVLFQTPSRIQAQLTPFKVCTWKSTTGHFYLSNIYETVALNQSLKTSWSNLLPAKGSGHGSISMGGFRISNEHSRPETQELVDHLEYILNTEIICYEDYDC